MTDSLIPPSNRTPPLFSAINVWSSKHKPIFIALIILGVIGLSVGGVGIASFGSAHAWWGAGVLSNLHQIDAIICMSAGGGSAFVFFAIGIIGLVSSYIHKPSLVPESNLEENNFLEHEFPSEGLSSADESQDPPSPVTLLSSSDGLVSADEGQEIAQQSSDVDGVLQESVPDNLSFELSSSDSESFAPQIMGFSGEANGQRSFASTKSTGDASKVPEGEGEKPKTQVESGSLESSWIQMDIEHGSIHQTAQLYSYDVIATHKYRVVLDEYYRQLAPEFDLAKLKQQVEQWKEDDSLNSMLEHFHDLLSVMESYRCRDARNAYHTIILELRKVIVSKEYGDLCAESKYQTVKTFIRKLCLIRWGNAHLYNYLKDSVHVTLGDDIRDVETRDLSSLVQEMNKGVNRAPFLKKGTAALWWQKCSGALGLADYCGDKNIPNVRALQTYENTNGETLTVTYMRHGTPTALRQDQSYTETAVKQTFGPLARVAGMQVDSGERVTPDYQEFLRALEVQKESLLFCVYQRKQQTIVEDESNRVEQITQLQQEHKNIFVLVQPVEGPLFEHSGQYSKMTTFEELQQAIEDEFFISNTWSTLPQCLQKDEEYKNAFRQLLVDVKEIFFLNHVVAFDSDSTIERTEERLKTEVINLLESIESMHELTAEMSDSFIDETSLSRDAEVLKYANQKMDGAIVQDIREQTQKKIIAAAVQRVQVAQTLSTWQSYILLVYAFQKMDLKFRLNRRGGYTLSMYTTPCKDFLDRGGNQGFVEDRLLHYMLGIEQQSASLQEALYNLVGPPIAVRKTGAIEHRISPGLHVEKLLASMDAEAREKLANYTFGNGWKVRAVEVPKRLDQSGVPRLQETIKYELAANTVETEEDVFNILGKYVDFDCHQWEAFDVAMNERYYIENGEVQYEKLVKQVERDLEHHQNYVDKEWIVKQGQESPPCEPLPSFKDVKSAMQDHCLIGQDERNALRILSAFQQQLGAPPQLSIRTALGKWSDGLDGAFTVTTIANEQHRRCYQLDMSSPDQIVISFKNIFGLKPNIYGNGKIKYEFPCIAKIIYTKDNTGALQAEGYFTWSVRDAVIQGP